MFVPGALCIGDGAKTVSFPSLLRVRVEVVRLMSNPSEDRSPVLKQHVMGVFG